MSTGILIVIIVAPFLPDKAEKMIVTEINPMVIIWVTFCTLVGEFTVKFFTNFNGFCCVSFALVTDMIMKIFNFQSCFCFRNNFAFCDIGCFVVETQHKKQE